jgi:hypothetical protein
MRLIHTKQITEDVRQEIYIELDDISIIEDCFDSPETASKIRDKIAKGLETAWCIVTYKTIVCGVELGKSTAGVCSYDSEQDIVNCSYIQELAKKSHLDARQKLSQLNNSVLY